MSRFAYVGVLAFVVIGTGWLEVALRTGVYARWRRLLAALVPVVVLFCLWDLYAIAAGHWTFDPERTTGASGLASRREGRRTPRPRESP